jgi:uncharacterized protein YegL
MTTSRPQLPGGQTQRRDMHFFWLLDGSSSMAGEKIQSLNFAVAQAIPGMQSVAAKNPQARLLVRVLRFADRAEWIVQEPTPITELQWETDIAAKGETAMGQALAAVVDELDKVDTSRRFFPPVIILVTDGHSTDRSDVFEAALSRLKAHKLGGVSTRFAVAIGSDADIDCLKTFIGNDEIPVLEAKDSADLEAMIRVVSQAAIARSSEPMSDAPIKQVKAVESTSEPIEQW